MDGTQSKLSKLRIETILERALFASRWLLVPFYVGLALSIFVLLVKFLQELLHLIPLAFKGTEADVILGVLSLIDLALMGSLLVIVIFSGYENFVSRIDTDTHRDWPEWMGSVDFTALKLKLLSSIVAISAIHLLKQFMSLASKPGPDDKLIWYVIIHVVFVTSGVLLALSDRIAAGGAGHGEATRRNGEKSSPGAPPTHGTAAPSGNTPQ